MASAMNVVERRAYNARKQREYRLKRRKPFTKAEAIFHAAGHCAYCGMMLDAEYHKLHPLVGCQKAAEANQYTQDKTS